MISSEGVPSSRTAQVGIFGKFVRGRSDLGSGIHDHWNHPQFWLEAAGRPGLDGAPGQAGGKPS